MIGVNKKAVLIGGVLAATWWIVPKQEKYYFNGFCVTLQSSVDLKTDGIPRPKGQTPGYEVSLDSLQLEEAGAPKLITLQLSKSHDDGHSRTANGLAVTRSTCEALSVGNGLVTLLKTEDQKCYYAGDRPHVLFPETLTDQNDTVAINCGGNHNNCFIEIVHENGWKLTTLVPQDILPQWQEITVLMTKYFDENLRVCGWT